MKQRPKIYISYYIHLIINIYNLCLFIYMYWRNTCIKQLVRLNMDFRMQPHSAKFKLKQHKRRSKEERWSEKRFKKSKQIVWRFDTVFRGFRYQIL